MLIPLLVLVLVAFCAFWIIGEMALPAPMNTVVRVLVGIVFLVAVLHFAGITLP